MKAQQPAEGILKQNDFGDAKFYYIQCDCGSDDCAHVVEVEADEMHVHVNLYHKQHTKWWEKNRWQQIWQILTKGYTEMETTIVLNEQTALNYGQTLINASSDVKQFRQARNAKNKEK